MKFRLEFTGELTDSFKVSQLGKYIPKSTVIEISLSVSGNPYNIKMRINDKDYYMLKLNGKYIILLQEGMFNNVEDDYIQFIAEVYNNNEYHEIASNKLTLKLNNHNINKTEYSVKSQILNDITQITKKII